MFSDVPRWLLWVVIAIMWPMMLLDNLGAPEWLQKGGLGLWFCFILAVIVWLFIKFIKQMMK